MLLRTVLAAANLGVLSVTLAAWLAAPQYASLALYGCLAWVGVAFVVMYSSWGNRPVGGRAPARASGTPSGGARAGGAPSGIDFCIYCAAPIPPGSGRCPSCGHAAPTL